MEEQLSAGQPQGPEQKKKMSQAAFILTTVSWATVIGGVVGFLALGVGPSFYNSVNESMSPLAPAMGIAGFFWTAFITLFTAAVFAFWAAIGSSVFCLLFRRDK